MGGVMKSLMGAKPIKPLVSRMPDYGDPALEEEKRRKAALEMQQRGRESTRLTEAGGVKAPYTGGVLGA